MSLTSRVIKHSEISFSNSYPNQCPRVKVLTIMLHEKKEERRKNTSVVFRL